MLLMSSAAHQAEEKSHKAWGWRMGKEQEGISDARGHENEQKKEKNRLRQEKKQGKTNVSMHEARRFQKAAGMPSSKAMGAGS